MAVARSDDGSGNLTRKRTARKTAETPAAATTLAPAGPSPTPAPRAPGLRLDDLYRLPMPKLLALAEREGIGEHTDMNRAQLIVAVVRKQVERGEVVRGSGVPGRAFSAWGPGAGSTLRSAGGGAA